MYGGGYPFDAQERYDAPVDWRFWQTPAEPTEAELLSEGFFLRAVRGTRERCHSLTFVILDGVFGSVAGVIAGAASSSLSLGEQVLVGVVVGLAAILGLMGLVFLFSLARAPFTQREEARWVVAQLAGEEYAIGQIKSDCFTFAEKVTEFRMDRQKERPQRGLKEILDDKTEPDPLIGFKQKIFDGTTKEQYEEQLSPFIALLARTLKDAGHISQAEVDELNTPAASPTELTRRAEKLKSIARRLPGV
jgi:hypothetical protein